MTSVPHRDKFEKEWRRKTGSARGRKDKRDGKGRGDIVLEE
jgi:hypothetical protein